jgi:hypothetical protein
VVNEPAFLTGGIATHYLVAVVFSIFYHWLWYNDISSLGFVHCILLGFLGAWLVFTAWAFFKTSPPLDKFLFFICDINWSPVFWCRSVYSVQHSRPFFFLCNKYQHTL